MTSQIGINEEAVQAFAAQLQGRLILPDDAGYDDARAVWNGMIDRYPAMIARCETVADVIASVNFAREHDLLISVRGGGHNVAGHATNDGGIVIDLSPMKAIEVDPERRIAHAQPGVIWGELDQATQAYGLATPGGEVSDTGIAGLTLGGGMGYLRRKHGLSADNLIAAEMVTAAGEVVTADETHNTELLWGLRGGGGNFGIVTRFTYRLHELDPQIFGASVIYPLSAAREVLLAWRAFCDTAPDEVSSAFMIWSIPAIPDFPEELHNQAMCMIDAPYAGDPQVGEALLQPLREISEPLLDLSGTQSFVEVQSAMDDLLPARVLRYYWKSLNARELGDELIDRFIAHGRTRPSPKNLFVIRHLGGAMGRVPADATAFGDRSAQYNISLDSTWVDPAEDEQNITWTRMVWDDLRPYSDGGVYLNFPGFQEEGEALMRAQFGQNYERLQALKRQYDPDNVFRVNQNIAPK
jgi:FAD/FMN-containing dehydrogenase